MGAFSKSNISFGRILIWKAVLKNEEKKVAGHGKVVPPPKKDVRFVQAESCSKNRGVINNDGVEQPSPHNIYVDDNLMADIR